MSALAILGFLTVIIMLVVIMTKKCSPTVALIAIPIITGILACAFMVTDPEKAPGVINFAANFKKLGSMITGSSGIGSVAATGVMFIFSILFFGILTDAGTFRPIINGLLKFMGTDPVKIAIGTAILAIGVAASAIVARLTRILARRVLAMDYVTAARVAGTSWIGIVRIHVLPNIWPTLIVNLALQFGLAVIAEASLSYLGLGAPPPNASWGRLLQEAQGTVYTAPFGAVAPGLALLSLVIGLNLTADGLRDIADPTRRTRT